MQRDSTQAPGDFTYSLCGDLLCPEKLIFPLEIQSEIEHRQVRHGVYAWWFDTALPLVPRDGCLRMGLFDMLYVGIAPPRRSGDRGRRLTPVKQRLLQNHLRGSIRRSTLRQSLAAILAEQMGFEFWRDTSGKSRMRPEDEVKLTEWITTHAAVTFVHTDYPLGIEEALVRKGPPLPLNLSMSQHPFRKTLSALRRHLGRDKWSRAC